MIIADGQDGDAILDIHILTHGSALFEWWPFKVRGYQVKSKVINIGQCEVQYFGNREYFNSDSTFGMHSCNIFGSLLGSRSLIKIKGQIHSSMWLGGKVFHKHIEFIFCYFNSISGVHVQMLTFLALISNNLPSYFHASYSFLNFVLSNKQNMIVSTKNITLMYNVSVKQFGSQMRPNIWWWHIWIQIVCNGLHQLSSKSAVSKQRVSRT